MIFSTRYNAAGGTRITTTVELLEEQPRLPWRVSVVSNDGPLFNAHFAIRSKAESKADAMHKCYLKVNKIR